MNPDIFAGFHIFPAVFYRIVVTIQNKTGGISMKHIVLTGGGTAGTCDSEYCSDPTP